MVLWCHVKYFIEFGDIHSVLEHLLIYFKVLRFFLEGLYLHMEVMGQEKKQVGLRLKGLIIFGSTS